MTVTAYTIFGGCHVSIALDQELCKLGVTPFGCPVQRGPPILGPGCHIGTILNQKPCDLDVTQ